MQTKGGSGWTEQLNQLNNTDLKLLNCKKCLSRARILSYHALTILVRTCVKYTRICAQNAKSCTKLHHYNDEIIILNI